MKFELPRRHRKSYEAIAKRKIDENLNKEESLEIFDKIKKEYNNSPRSFGSNTGKKEMNLEMLIVIGNQISNEYKDLQIDLKQGIPEINKNKPYENRVKILCRILSKVETDSIYIKPKIRELIISNTK